MTILSRTCISSPNFRSTKVIPLTLLSIKSIPHPSIYIRNLSTSKPTFTDSRMNLIKNALFEVVPEAAKGKSFYELKATLPGSKGELDFSKFKGKAVLIVNTASKCGFTPQYTGLEELYKSYHDKGLEVLGFPSNEFGGQDPGSDDEIASFCQLNHGVTFPLMKKSEVNGNNMNEVFAWLKANGAHVPGAGGVAGTTSIKWNFTKFLVDRNGQIVGRYSPSTTPEHMKAEIEKLLAAGVANPDTL